MTAFVKQTLLLVAEFLIAFLPLGRVVDAADFNGRDLVLRTVGGPVGVVGGDDVGPRFREVEGGVHHARSHPFSDPRTEYGLPRAAADTDPVTFVDATALGVAWVDFQAVFVVPGDVLGTPGLGADVVLAEDAPGGQQQGITIVDLFLGGYVAGEHEAPLATHELIDVHGRRAVRCRGVARPLQAAMAVQFGVADVGEGRRQAGDFIHDFRRMLVMHGVTQGVRQGHRAFPVGLATQGLHDLAHPGDAPLGVGEGAVFFQERAARQEHMGELGGFVEENILHHDAFHGRQRRGDVLGIRVALGNVFALAIQALKAAAKGGLEHVGNAQARIGLQGHVPGLFELRPYHLVGDVPVAGQLVGEGAHVAGALNVVLPTQRVHAHAFAADVARGHGQVGDAHDRRAALAVLGDAQAVVDRGVAAGSIQTGGGTDVGRGYAADLAKDFRRVFRAADEFAPAGEIAALATGVDKGLVQQALGDDDVGQGVKHGDVGARAQGQVQFGAGMRRVHQINASRIDDDQSRTFTQTAFELGSEHRVGVAGVGAHHQNHVGLHHRVEALSAGRFAQGLFQAITGRRVADPRAGVDVVVAERGTHQFLHQVGFFVGAAAGGDATNRIAAVLLLQPAEFAGGVGHRFVPADFLPRVVDVFADHRFGDAIRVGGVAPGKATFDAGMAVVGLTVFVRNHTHQFVAFHLGAERAAHPAIGTSGDHAAFGLAEFDYAFFHQGRGRAGLHTGAAGHAFRI